jgi:y4mF family transcriptional regulator
MAETLGEMVREHRRRARLTRMQLARMAGVGKTTIFDIENGKQSVHLDKVLAILKVLNISVHLESPLSRNDENSIRLSL